MSSYVLVTGGAGYIGSHTVVELCKAGYNPVVLDGLINASTECVKRIERITKQKIPFEKINMLNKEALRDVFSKYKFDAVINFAGLKAVGESCSKPMLYYQNNLIATMNLIEIMGDFNVKNMVFSSSATVYGDPIHLPLDESHPVGNCTNPYGKTKYFIEQMLIDLGNAEKDWNIMILRYFNPVGAHESGLIGEDPQGPPNNLMPYVAQVAVGRRDKLSVFGNDYDTPDGTGVRDYIHVVDLALGHLAALQKQEGKCGCKVYNLGTGQGYSVLDMVKAFEAACGRTIRYEITDRRLGDVAMMYACPKLAAKELEWKATRGLEQMCKDLWRWQSMNPEGFHSPVINGEH